MLQRNEHPTFTKTLPYSGKSVRIRPMTIKDEKILLMTSESQAERLDHIKQVLVNCVEGVDDFDELTFIDFQFLFVTVRATSIDSIVTLEHKIGDKTHMMTIFLDKPKIKNLELFRKNNNLKITATSGVTFRPPSYADIYYLATRPEENVDPVLVIARAVDTIYFGDTVFDTSNATPDEIVEMVENLPAKSLQGMNTILKDLPYMYFEGVYTVDGVQKVEEVTAFADFF